MVEIITVDHILFNFFYVLYSRILVISWLSCHQAGKSRLLSMGFSRQAYWSGLPCPPPGDLPDPGIEYMSLTSPVLAGKFFTTGTTWKTPGTSLPGFKSLLEPLPLLTLGKPSHLLCLSLLSTKWA